MVEKDTPQAQPKWDREEQVLLVVEYYSCKDDSESMKRSCVFLSNILRKRAKILGLEIGEKYRNENGITRQMKNLRHCVPENKNNTSGHESLWMYEILAEYSLNPSKMNIEAYEILKKYAL